MLFARRNQAFVDDEEQSKKIVFERTLKWVKRLRGKQRGGSNTR